MTNNDIQITVYSAKQYDTDWPPERFSAFVAFMAAKLAEIPAEFSSSASIDIGTEQNYDSCYASLRITYYRPMTAEERSERDRQEQVAQENHKAQELRKLAQLKAKYEGQS